MVVLPRIFLSPNWGIATELVRNYLQYLALAPVFFLNGHKPPPQKKDLVLHNGKSELDHELDTEVILIVFQEGWHVLEMVFWKNRGASGWVDLQDDPKDFESVLKKALNGHTPVATRSTEPYVPKLNGFLDRKTGRHLTRRELDIATRLTRGSSDKEIGKQLKITWGTVHNHRKSIYRKLGVHSVPQMIHKLQGLDKKA
jgi:DNA-binding CsgD family transcriptional regulator